MIQIIQDKRKPSIGDRLSQAVGVGIDRAGEMINQYDNLKKGKAEDEALKRLTGKDLSGLNPELKKIYTAELAKSQTQRDQMEYEDKQLFGNTDLSQGKYDYSKMTEDQLVALTRSKRHKSPAQTELSLRKDKRTQSSKPIDPEQLSVIKSVRNQEGFDDLDELAQYRAFTDSGVSKENAEAESKLRGQQLTRQEQAFENSFKPHQDFINETTDKYKGFETEMKPRLLQMQNMNSDDLISPTASVFLEHLGIPLGALDDPSSELFDKLSQDLLKGLPETYGSRILKVEVENFLKTIPRLSNSADGRRMIASNMLKLGELKEVYYNEMRKQQLDSIDNRKPLPKDFQQRVFDQVKPRIDKLNNEFVKLSEIKSVPEGEIPFFGPDGEVVFVPKEHSQWALENGGKRIW